MGPRALVRASGAVLLTVLLLVGVAPAPTASADPCGCSGVSGYGGGCGSGYGGWRNGRFGRSWGRSLGHRPNTYDGCHEARFLARGQGWSLLRRYVHRVRIQNHHVHPTFYFQQRWPRRAVDGAYPWGGLGCVGHDFPITECPLVAASLGGDGELLDGMRELTPADRLDRGMERCFRSAYEEAAEDFAFVAKQDPRDARARYGLMFCRVMQNDFRGAVGDMRRLQALDALDARDRLEMDSTFHDPDAFASFQTALDAFTQWKFHDVNAQIVAGWSYAVIGEEEQARSHFRSALRFAPRHSVANHLLRTLDGDEEEPSTESPPQTESAPAPVPPFEPAGNLATREGRPG